MEHPPRLSSLRMLALLALALGSWACAGSNTAPGSSTRTSTFAIVSALDAVSGSEFTPRGFSVYRVSPDGVHWTRLETILDLGSMALDTRRSLVHVGRWGERRLLNGSYQRIATVVTYRIDALTGAPMRLATADIGDHDATHVFAHPGSAVVFAADQSFEGTVGLRLDETQSRLTPVEFSDSPSPRQVALDPLGRFAYYTLARDFDDARADDILAYRLDDTALRPGAGVVGRGSVALDREGRLAFSAAPETGVVSSRVDETNGAWRALSSVAVDVAPRYALAFEPNQRCLYALSHGSDTGRLTSLRVGNDGQLTLLTSVAAQGTSLSLTPDGRYAYVAGDNGLLTAYALDAQGGLTARGRVLQGVGWLGFLPGN